MGCAFSGPTGIVRKGGGILPAHWKRDWCSQKQREVICTCYFEFFTLGWQKCTGRWDKLMTLHYTNQLTENCCLLLRALTHDVRNSRITENDINCLTHLIFLLIIVTQIETIWSQLFVEFEHRYVNHYNPIQTAMFDSKIFYSKILFWGFVVLFILPNMILWHCGFCINWHAFTLNRIYLVS